jgi:hypothetical protein
LNSRWVEVLPEFDLIFVHYAICILPQSA